MQNNLRIIRLAQRLSQEELAKKAGISRVTISQIERSNDVNITTRTMIALANALNTDVEGVFFAQNAKSVYH